MPYESLKDLMAWQPPLQDYVVDSGVLPSLTSMIIFGPPKSWKTMLSRHLAFCVAEGRDWFGFKTKPSIVYLNQVELSRSVNRKGMVKYANGAESYPSNLFISKDNYLKLDTSFGKALLDKDMKELRAKFPEHEIVLILDPLYKLMVGKLSDDTDIRRFLDAVDEVKWKHKLTIVIVHHSHKMRYDDKGIMIEGGAEEAFGSNMLQAWADTMIRLRVNNKLEGGNGVDVSFELTRHAEDELQPFSILWDRSNLQPTLSPRISAASISIRSSGLVTV